MPLKRKNPFIEEEASASDDDSSTTMEVQSSQGSLRNFLCDEQMPLSQELPSYPGSPMLPSVTEMLEEIITLPLQEEQDQRAQDVDLDVHVGAQIVQQGSDFRFSAVSCLLTYARCPAPPQFLLDWFQVQAKTLNNRQILKYSIGREHHQDGELHLHAFLSYSTKLNVRNSRFWDLEFQGKTYHPNIRAVKWPNAAILYTQKEGFEILSNVSPTQKDPVFTRVALRILNDHATAEQIMLEEPGFYLQHCQKIKAFYDDAYKPPPMVVILKPWQHDLEQIILQDPTKYPQSRMINWFWEPNGNQGKTFMASYLICNHGAILLAGKSIDVLYAYRGQRVAIFDFSRSVEDHVPYGTMESIKNGVFFSSKYMPVMRFYPSPHVVVFANFAPDLNKMSMDRWNVVNLSEYIELNRR